MDTAQHNDVYTVYVRCGDYWLYLERVGVKHPGVDVPDICIFGHQNAEDAWGNTSQLSCDTGRVQTIRGAREHQVLGIINVAYNVGNKTG